MHKIKRYFQGVKEQAKMVRWPKRRELAGAVATVLVVVAFAAVCLIIDDLIVSKLLKTLDDAFPTGDTSEATSLLEAIKTFISLR